MINKETLEAVKNGILTDKELDKAINHYTILEEHLKCHGELYQLTWLHVVNTLDRLNDFKRSRAKK